MPLQRSAAHTPLERRLALQDEAIDVAARAYVIVGTGLMHDAAVIPHHPVAMTPLVAIFVFFCVACRISSSMNASASLSFMPKMDSIRTGLRNNALRPVSGCVRTSGWIPGGRLRRLLSLILPSERGLWVGEQRGLEMVFTIIFWTSRMRLFFGQPNKALHARVPRASCPHAL